MIFTIFVFSQCSVLAMVIVVCTTTTQVHSPFAIKYGGLSLSVVRDTPEGTKEYITLILGMSYGSATLAHFTLRGIFMEFEKRFDS